MLIGIIINILINNNGGYYYLENINFLLLFQ